MPVQLYECNGPRGLHKATPPGCTGSRDGVLRWMEAYADALECGMYKARTSGGFRAGSLLCAVHNSICMLLVRWPVLAQSLCQTGLRWASARSLWLCSTLLSLMAKIVTRQTERVLVVFKSGICYVNLLRESLLLAWELHQGIWCGSSLTAEIDCRCRT